MSKYPTALASALENVEFTRLSAEEIEKISVKRIHVTPTLDSLGGPAPGGLYDPALGAIRVLDTTQVLLRLIANAVANTALVALPAR